MWVGPAGGEGSDVPDDLALTERVPRVSLRAATPQSVEADRKLLSPIHPRVTTAHPTRRAGHGVGDVLPVVSVDDVGVVAPVGAADEGEGLVGGIAQSDEVGDEPVRGVSEDSAGEVLVAHRGVAGADSEVGGCEHHGHRGLTEVVLEPVAVELVCRLGRDKGDGGR